MGFVISHPAHTSDVAIVFIVGESDGKIEVIIMVLDDLKIEKAYCFNHKS